RADGDIEIEPDLHAEPLRELFAGAQLPVGDPLHELDERDLILVGSCQKLGAFLDVRLPPLLRPFPPWLLETVPQRLEAGKAEQQRTAFDAEGFEIRARRRI